MITSAKNYTKKQKQTNEQKNNPRSQTGLLLEM